MESTQQTTIDNRSLEKKLQALSNGEAVRLTEAEKQKIANLEDTMCAGAIVAGLENYDYESDTVVIAKKLYEQSKDDILSSMKKSSHAKRLSGYDNIKDIEFCSEIDKQEILPYLDGDQIVLL